MTLLVVLLIFGIVVNFNEMLVLYVLDNFQDMEKSPPKHSFNISRALIISLYPENMGSLVTSIQHYLHIPYTTVFRAVNGSQAIHSGALRDLSLYTQYLMLSGIILFFIIAIL